MFAKVLLVDDNQLLLQSLTQTVEWESAGCRVCAVARNAVEALAQIALNPPDVVITDIKMPGMSGIDFAGQVKSILPGCGIIIITGYQQFEYAQAALRLGAADILLKPVRNADVIKALKKALKDRPETGEPVSGFQLAGDNVERLRQIAVDIVRLLGSYHPNEAQTYTDAVRKIEEMTGKADITDYLEDTLRGFRSSLVRSEGHPVVEKLLEYIQVGYNEDISLSSAAEKFKISQGYLSRLIKAETGRSFTELLLEKRMEKAKALLRNADMRATQVAAEVGYEDYAYFYQVFRRVVGISPNEYRKLYE